MKSPPESDQKIIRNVWSVQEPILYSDPIPIYSLPKSIHSQIVYYW